MLKLKKNVHDVYVDTFIYLRVNDSGNQSYKITK